MLKGLGGMGDMLKHAQKMQKEMEKVQNDLREKVVEASSGGGMVKVLVNGQQELLSVKIDPEVVGPEDVGMLEDLVLSAVTLGIKKSQDLAKQEMSKITGGLNIPGLF